MTQGPPGWLENWRARHQTRVSLVLHVVGIPLAVAALLLAAYQLALWRWDLWWRPAALLVLGYALQIVGHWYEGNDVGEWILVKRLLGRPYIAISPRFARDSVAAIGPGVPESPRVRTVAVLGASADRRKFSNKSVRAHVRRGWTVYPVNPKGGRIEGLPVYPSLAEIPVRLDRVTLYVPPAIGETLLPAVAHAHPQEFYVNPGAESAGLIARARALGLDPILACSIVALGETPASYPA